MGFSVLGQRSWSSRGAKWSGALLEVIGEGSGRSKLFQSNISFPSCIVENVLGFQLKLGCVRVKRALGCQVRVGREEGSLQTLWMWLNLQQRAHLMDEVQERFISPKSRQRKQTMERPSTEAFEFEWVGTITASEYGLTGAVSGVSVFVY